VALLEGRVSAVSGSITAKAAYSAAVKAEEEELLQTQAVVNALRKTLLAMYTDPSTLGDFGLSPPKKPNITPAQRVVAAAKAKATRKARHTMGSQQKKAVTGSPSTSNGSATSA
jgi:hypothetical protein